MRRLIAAGLFLFPGIAMAQTIQPGRWDVTSTIVDITVPGAPGFLLRMARGRSKTEHKCVPAGQGPAALLVPDPKAKCGIVNERVADGHYAQTLSCPRKHGDPLTVSRAGTYDASGFAGRVTMTGPTSKGGLNIVLDQHTVHVSGKCSG